VESSNPAFSISPLSYHASAFTQISAFRIALISPHTRSKAKEIKLFVGNGDGGHLTLQFYLSALAKFIDSPKISGDLRQRMYYISSCTLLKGPSMQGDGRCNCVQGFRFTIGFRCS
ncbi:hypothetical protein Tcan_17183, partial [Toxocara canis]